jgi:hypothetical protein
MVWFIRKRGFIIRDWHWTFRVHCVWLDLLAADKWGLLYYLLEPKKYMDWSFIDLPLCWLIINSACIDQLKVFPWSDWSGETNSGTPRIGINSDLFHMNHYITGQWQHCIVIVYLLSHKNVIRTIYILFLKHFLNFCCWFFLPRQLPRLPQWKLRHW